jgi:2,3-bisphosphoglycerate-independent phosphoglycerate mutase
MLLLSDHKTLTSNRGHDGEPVPYVIYDSRAAKAGKQGSGLTYTEKNAGAGPYIHDGTTLIDKLFEA